MVQLYIVYKNEIKSLFQGTMVAVETIMILAIIVDSSSLTMDR